jgi:hypothetical protein
MDIRELEKDRRETMIMSVPTKYLLFYSHYNHNIYVVPTKKTFLPRNCLANLADYI